MAARCSHWRCRPRHPRPRSTSRPANNLFLTGAPGEDNDIEHRRQRREPRAADTEGLTAGPGCVQVNANEASCPLAAFDFAYVLLGNGDDGVDADPTTRSTSTAPTRPPRGRLTARARRDDRRRRGQRRPVHRLGATTRSAARRQRRARRRLGASTSQTAARGNDVLKSRARQRRPGRRRRLRPGQLPLPRQPAQADDRQRRQRRRVDGVESDNIHTDVERVDGGNGNDEITGSAGPDVILRERRQRHRARPGRRDEIEGEDGNDVLRGDLDGDDVEGGPDNDEVDGGFGDDELDGGTGNDEVNGSLGVDDVFGGPDNDELLGGLERRPPVRRRRRRQPEGPHGRRGAVRAASATTPPTTRSPRAR